MTKTIEQLNNEFRVSVVKWNENDYSVQVQYNPFPQLDPHWQDKKWVQVMDEAELGSSMQVYGYIQEARNEYL